MDYDTDPLKVGVPQLFVRNVVDGGIKAKTTDGAVPKVVVAPLVVVAVPPVICAVDPGVEVLAALQSVVKVITVGVLVLFTLA